MMQLILSDKLMAQICRHIVTDYPREACGLLIGLRGGGGDGQVTRVIPSPNMAEHPDNSFEISPELILRCHKQLRGGNETILGHYHSHPDGLAQPSARDRRQNHDPGMVWVIARVAHGQVGGLKAFCAEKAGADFVETPIVYF